MRRRTFLKALAGLGMGGWGGYASARTEGNHLMAVIDWRVIALMRGDGTIKIYRPMAHGANGAAAFRLRGDSITPTGTYRIEWVDRHSPFRLFFGLNYPLPSQAKVALDRGLITGGQARAIINAHREGRRPPQNTPLGGDIGLHGMGWRNPAVNKLADWTAGCLAVSNTDIDELSKVIGIGTPITIVGKQCY